MSRKRITIQARELSDMDVNIISLVKRGANRVPFRIIKSDGDSEMLNLSTLFLAKKEKTPAVVAVILAKSADQEAYTTAFAEGGFEVDHVVESDGGIATLMFTKSDDMEDVAIYKINEDAAIAIANMQKGLDMFPDSNSFSENISKAGFAPSYRMANEILSDTIGNIMFSDGDAAVTKAAISKAIEDFQGYIEAVMSVIPVNAFKAEDIALEVQKGLIPQAAPVKPKAKKVKTPAKKEDGEEGEEAAADDGEGGDAEAEAEGGDDAGEAEDSGTEEVAKDDATDQTQTGDTEALTALQKSLDGITESLASVSTQITTATDAVKEELSERLDTLEAKVKKTDEALAGTVHSEDADEDENSVAAKKAQGSEEVNWDNVLDFGDVEFS